MSDVEVLKALLARLQDKPGFPALSESVAAINEITNSDDQNIDDLAVIISRDVGLTTSLLRVANSASYRAASGKGISTVSRAVNVLGFSTLRDIALTVVLFNQMKSHPSARELKEAFLRAQLAGTLAREAGRLFMPRQAEEVYTAALFHSLGQFLTLLYFPEEAQGIRALIQQQGLAEHGAVTQVLGVDFARLGQAVAEQWHFPTPLVRCLQELPEGIIERPETPEDTLWMLSGFGNEVCASLAANPGQTPGEGLSRLRQRFAQVMAFSGPQLHTLVQKSFDDAKVFASTMGVSLAQSSFAKQVTTWMESDPDDENGQKPSAENTTADALTPASLPKMPKAPSNDAHQMLSTGINKLSHSMVGDFRVDDILRMALDILLQAMDFQRVLLCMRDDKSGYMVGRSGCGKDAAMVVRKFRFPLQDTPNVFQLSIDNGVDLVIKDIADPKIVGKIPPWYRATLSARSFALMPLMVKGKAVALIYCDKQQANSIVITEKELSLMKTLRNQILLAIKQSPTG